MAQAGAALDYAVLRVDLADCADKATLMQRFAAAGRFPEWFGGNWDALADSAAPTCRGCPRRGYLLLVEHADAGARRTARTSTRCSTCSTKPRSAGPRSNTAFWALLPFPAEQLAALEGEP